MRRKFMELKLNGHPVATEARVYIGYLYDLGRVVRARPSEQKQRRQYAKPLLKVFLGWLTSISETSAPNGALHKAIVFGRRG